MNVVALSVSSRKGIDFRELQPGDFLNMLVHRRTRFFGEPYYVMRFYLSRKQKGSIHEWDVSADTKEAVAWIKYAVEMMMLSAGGMFNFENNTQEENREFLLSKVYGENIPT